MGESCCLERAMGESCCLERAVVESCLVRALGESCCLVRAVVESCCLERDPGADVGCSSWDLEIKTPQLERKGCLSLGLEMLPPDGQEGQSHHLLWLVSYILISYSGTRS